MSATAGHTVAVAVLGAGSWGTALALQLARNAHDVRLWGHRPEHIEQLREQRCNRRYLADFAFPDNLTVCTGLAEAVRHTQLALVVVPSHSYGATLRQLLPYLTDTMGCAWATKGLEHGSGRFLHQVSREILGEQRPLALISGPSFAREVAAGLPTALTVAAEDIDYAHWVATLLHGSGMLTYTSQDIIGVQLGGAVKNVLAIATGIADGLGFGANTRAAVITRGLAELRRLNDAAGGRRDTLMGLTGIGDLVLTCTDDQSRNRRFGLAIGQGHSFEQARRAIGQVVEGAGAVREIMQLARRYAVEMPICEQVEQVLHHGLSPRAAVEILLTRPPRPEDL
jgi:glycerol-3-phosphate dehydrogenase (NAD(P)+)